MSQLGILYWGTESVSNLFQNLLISPGYDTLLSDTLRSLEL